MLNIESPIIRGNFQSGIRIPPQDIEAEKALLGSVMQQPQMMYEVTDFLNERCFYVEKHRLIWKVIMELFGKNEPIDLLSLSSRLREKNMLDQVGGASYLAELVESVPSASNAEHYAKIVQKKYLLRNLILASEQVGHLGYTEELDLDELLDKAEKIVFGVTANNNQRRFISIKDTLTEAWERLDHLHKTKEEIRGVPTGFIELDNRLAGLQKSDLVILAARPSMGKTSLALDIARNTACKHNTPVGIFSLEMSSQQLVDRMLAAESKVDSWKLRTGRLSTDQEFSLIRDSLDKLSKAPIFIDDDSTNNIIKMRSVARRLKSEHGLGLIIVDYLQLMVPHRQIDSLVQQVTEISRSLKSLARELEVPVLALSQLNRNVEQRGGEPRLSDLRDSGCLTGETKIIEADTGEPINIRDLVGKSDISVLALDEKKKLTVCLVEKVFSSGIKKVFKMQTRSGRSIRASANHRFLTIEGWRRLDEIKIGTSISLARDLPMPERPPILLDAEIILLAHLIGDGCVLKKQPIHYTSADMANLKVVSKSAKDLFQIESRLIKQKNWYHLYLPSPYPLARGVHHPIVNWFSRLGLPLARSYEKFIPQAIFKSPSSSIALFLRHLWATDGNISWKKLAGRKPAGAIYYSTTSIRLATQVQHLLLRIGIQSTLRTIPQKKDGKTYKPNHQIHIQGKKRQIKFCETVGSHGLRGEIVPSLIQALNLIDPNPNTDIIPKEAWTLHVNPARINANLSWRELSSGIEAAYQGTALFSSGLSRERLNRVASFLQNDSLKQLASSDIYWDEIKSITPDGEEEVFDATVPGVHNFLANDIVVHNSIEQDADVVMFIHREDKYDKESEKPNIAKIIIAKHRNGPTGMTELYFDEKRTSFVSIDKSNFGEF